IAFHDPDGRKTTCKLNDKTGEMDCTTDDDRKKDKPMAPQTGDKCQDCLDRCKRDHKRQRGGCGDDKKKAAAADSDLGLCESGCKVAYCNNVGFEN
ncbi:MAG: hypothetical protein JNK82_17045, partial [Myxococcaceae bacterium]|nr:hypothetical protein [Myxococcaceae bacterium]